ncbi:MAG: GNAT family N-acetyltransferase [Acidobacteria bacterium]|jgi:GNAT superfamily N-acetyltransferase|nr:GNAT family N-acetyltransferase [Acidobacteriota bacterium]
MIHEHHRDGFTVSTDPARVDVDAVHAFLTTAYWCEGIPRQTVARALSRSLCFGLYEGERQIGLARVITDATTFAYLCDVYVLPARRGKGLGRWLMECVMAHPDLQELRRFTLVTRDAHELYRPFGFAAVQNPARHLEIVRPGLYKPAC